MYLNGTAKVLPGRRFPGTLGCHSCTTRRRSLPLGRLRGQGRGLGQNESFLAAGTALSYNVTYAGTFSRPSDIVNAVKPVLASQWGILVDSEFDQAGFFTSDGFTIQVHTNRDYGQAADVKSIIDGELQNIGVTIQGSNISIIKSAAPASTGIAVGPGGVPLTPLAQAQQNYANAVASNDAAGAAQWAAVIQQLQSSSSSNLTDFLSGNAGWLAAGVGAIALFAFLENR